jgi:hypothetical protein
LVLSLSLRACPQGPTSSGKTSLVSYLAAQTGHAFVRINNHEQTDLQEYLGSYVSDESGRLVFREGLLVQAVRRGHWIVLDELNLAPTEVLEALNRCAQGGRHGKGGGGGRRAAGSRLLAEMLLLAAAANGFYVAMACSPHPPSISSMVTLSSHHK